ncbi:MAG: serine hydrolase domain-containing protein [Bacteroidota bacterium]
MNKSMTRLPLAIFLLLCFACENPSAQDNGQLKQVEVKLDSLFQDFDNLETPGYAVGISKGQKTLYQNGFGAANLDYKIPIETNSAFSIASVSKQFTAACVALLILEDKLSLDSPASQYVPELSKYKDTIRVKHLVYNTSGIIDYPRLQRPSGKSWVTFNYFDVDECIATSLAQDTLLFKPGEHWDYCNVNFMLLTKIVEKVSGQSFAEFAKSQLFDPLGMKNTFIHDDITQIVERRVTPYNPRNPEYLRGYAEYGIRLREEGKFIQHHRNSPHYGGSGVVTTIEDILLWSKNMDSHAFGGEEFYELMHRTPKFDHDRDNQAFGLYFGDFNGRSLVAWEGGDWGISSQLMRFPEQGVAIVLLSNLGSGEASRKANAIGDILVEAGIIE